MGYFGWVKIEYYKDGVLIKKDILDSYKFASVEKEFTLPQGADSIVIKWRSEYDYSSYDSETSEGEGDSE